MLCTTGSDYFLCEVSQQMVQGIVFMHTSNPPVVHLDLKPENVLVRHVNLGVVSMYKPWYAL